ncbi:DUF1642 domain-containing protein [Enterococcus faecalis]|uniref:DUF1642 domain-containing protein n=1 Tax=Acinetobacter baumannii TaxID=470 RepID=A0A6I4HNF1_ACIBA|nr:MULTISPECIES: DUF1642 domain-containing protein [Bacteria]EHA4047099.1 DUF1642 domain-containing protein [Enterococcus faecalis]EHN4295485.1 DUF1642 domain-containing protein [Enterococcus faecalis]EHN4654930.1 DUF1642 domain-containing protein [Enterococcus faecalis]EHQ9060447.1 DUF1642 domain-containing protein [Enterococcus faecalis]EJX9274120.1 DUF1642 domain-containing protein [Enterococcus faecalis]
MNKQELIDILENLECSTESLSYDNGYEQGVYDSLSHVILLDEPKKVVVPKFVAEWIEYAKKKGDSLIVSFNPWDLYGEEYIEATRWIDNNQETFALAWVNGYEVEKEQLYYVKLPEIGYMRFGKKYFYSTDKEDAKRYTENQIKAIDERYWPFAVKVDGE